MEQTKNGKRSRTLLKVLPEPCSRTLITGWTGSGKSTLEEVLIEAYHRKYSNHRIYVFDPKERFLPIEPTDYSVPTLFPEGYLSQIVGKSKVVPFVSKPMKKPRIPDRLDGALLISDIEELLKFCDWLLDNSDINYPTLLCLDESLETMKGVQAHKSFRKITQTGREKGIGCIILNQRPIWIDGTWISESENLFVGPLIKQNDRRTVCDNVAVPDAWDYLREPLGERWWLRFDQREHTVMEFKLNLGAINA